MKISKIMLLFLFTAVVASPATFAITVDSHLDRIDPIICKQNDTIKVTAQLWAENEYWDNPITLQDLDLYIYPKNQNTIVFHATEETDWPTGEAIFKINTKNMEPGTYTLKVRFDGGSEIFGSFRPCSTYSTFTVTT